MMKTKFAKGTNPWTGEKNMRKQTNYVDIATLVICDDPLPTRRVNKLKYAEVFAKLKPGQCIVCDPIHSAKIAHALNTWVDKHGLKFMVRTTNRYEKDGKGRVWLLAPEKRLKVA